MNEQARAIGRGNDSGSREEVYFTDDLETKAEEFFYLDDMTISIDEEIGDLPSMFPINYTLVRN